MMQRIGLGITALLLLMTACQAPSGPRSRSFDEECWAYPDSLSWEQELAGERLEMMVLLKFTDAYNYRNLYLINVIKLRLFNSLCLLLFS
jgi:hypothetical protein